MMLVLWLLLAIGGLASLVGWVLLLVAGFRTSVGWGLVILLLGWLLIPVIVFIVKYWSDVEVGKLVKRGLALSLVGLVLTVVGWFGFAAKVASELMSEMEGLDLDEITIEEGDDSVPSDWDMETEPEAEAEAEAPTPTPAVLLLPTAEPSEGAEQRPTLGVAPLSAEARAARARARQDREQPRGEAIRFSEAGKYIGWKVLITTKDGSEFFATIISADSEKIRVERKVGAGNVTYGVEKPNVKEIRIRAD